MACGGKIFSVGPESARRALTSGRHFPIGRQRCSGICAHAIEVLAVEGLQSTRATDGEIIGQRHSRCREGAAIGHGDRRVAGAQKGSAQRIAEDQAAGHAGGCHHRTRV